MTDTVFLWVMVFVVSFSVIAFEWIRWWFKSPPAPMFFTVVGGVAIAYSYYRLRTARRQFRQLQQGLDGEKTVAEFLDALRANGAIVYHDVPGNGFNVDHVVLAASGVYAVETKTLSKQRSDAHVVFSQGTLLVDGHRPDKDPIGQAKASADWIFSVLKASTGKTFPVRPVILFPGWFVERMPRPLAREVWVLNPKNIAGFIEKEPVRLSDSDLHLACYHLERHIRITGGQSA